MIFSCLREDDGEERERRALRRAEAELEERRMKNRFFFIS